MTEHQHQKRLMEWARERGAVVDNFLWATPNGGYRAKREAGRLKAEGVKKGVPDLFYAMPCGPYHGLFIELKRSGGRVSEEQRVWIERLRRVGYRVEVCFGWEHAVAVIEDYLLDSPSVGEDPAMLDLGAEPVDTAEADLLQQPSCPGAESPGVFFGPFEWRKVQTEDAWHEKWVETEVSWKMGEGEGHD